MNAEDSPCFTVTDEFESGLPASLYDDPLDDDLPMDRVVTTTRRGLRRLTLLAAEVGARFDRHGKTLDPMAWLLAPRRLFGGKAAIEACLQREHFLRALLLHGLALGLDAQPAEIDDLLESEVKSSAALDGQRPRSRQVASMRQGNKNPSTL